LLTAPADRPRRNAPLEVVGHVGAGWVFQPLVVEDEALDEILLQARVSRDVLHYDLEAILAVGYRVRSQRGIQFRQWATRALGVNCYVRLNGCRVVQFALRLVQTDYVKLADMPVDEPPREKMARGGATALSDAELVALLIEPGRRGRSSLDIARELITGGAACARPAGMDSSGRRIAVLSAPSTEPRR
jgi:hypothetical protein